MNSTAEKLLGKPVYDKGLHKIGKVSRLYSDGRSQNPTWATVRTGGFFGNKESFVPLSLAEFRDGGRGVILQVDKEVVAGAPNIESRNEVAFEDQARLYQYYRSAMVAEKPNATAGKAQEEFAGIQNMSEGEHEVILRKKVPVAANNVPKES